MKEIFTKEAGIALKELLQKQPNLLNIREINADGGARLAEFMEAFIRKYSDALERIHTESQSRQ